MPQAAPEEERLILNEYKQFEYPDSSLRRMTRNIHSHVQSHRSWSIRSFPFTPASGRPTRWPCHPQCKTISLEVTTFARDR